MSGRFGSVILIRNEMEMFTDERACARLIAGSSLSSTRKSSKRERAEIQLTPEAWKILAGQDWYHGLMPRDEIEELLTTEGDFLVRKSDINDKVLLPLSVRHNGRIRHFVLKCDKGMWWLNDRKLKKKTLPELLEHHINTGTPIHTDGTLLKRGVPRPSYYLLHDQIELKNKLGEGAFGEVFAGTLKEFGAEIECAVKTLKGVMAKQKRIEFIREARLMRKFSHANIVRVFGVAPQQEPLMIILELSPGGSLKSHLQKASKSEVPVTTLVKYCRDAVEGMYYLASQKVIHRDIAARNCLLGYKNEVKISDFGLSVEGEDVVKAGENVKLPIKWLAPETLRKQEFTTKTDVWSFGVLIWEIFTRCSSDPYPGLTVDQVCKRILTSKASMEVPDEMPVLLQTCMRLCFLREPEERASFEELRIYLTGK